MILFAGAGGQGWRGAPCFLESCCGRLELRPLEWNPGDRREGGVRRLDKQTGDTLSIFFPAYNDWGTIASMVTLAHQVARGLTDDFEVIVVNDASPDHLEVILQELARIYPGTFRSVTHPVNRGYGGALRSGFAAATKQFVFYTDGDAQYDVFSSKMGKS